MTIDKGQLNGESLLARESESVANAKLALTDDQMLATARDEDMDETNADAVVQARPEWGSVAMLAAAASLGASVPGAMASAYAELFRSVELNGEFSQSNGGGPLGRLTKEEIAARKQDEHSDGWSEWAQTVPEAREKREREMQDTMSQADLDAMPWEGDLNEIWDMGGISATREKLYEAAKATRKNVVAP